MKGRLDRKKIDYVLYHYRLYYNIDSEVLSSIVPLYSHGDNLSDNKVYIPVSRESFKDEIVFNITGTPILFPTRSNIVYEHYILKEYVLFNYDILKCIFFLLSGWQEVDNRDVDDFGRFPFLNSVQSRFGFQHIPLVNYYFEILTESINKLIPHIEVKRKLIFKNTGFVLTHDIDKLYKYGFDRFKYELKKIRSSPFRIKSKVILRSIIAAIGRRINDPYFSFNFMLKVNQKCNIKSTYFFLPKGQRYVDGDYEFDGKELNGLLKKLHDNGDEMQLHGTVESHTSLKEFRRILAYCSSSKISEATGIRQHRLCYKQGVTDKIQEQVGMRYDASLGFAESEGFRNSFCMPFKLWDFSDDRMRDLWQIPLNVMDVTLFHYRRMDMKKARVAILDVLNNVRRFGGVFVLLWHNSHLDEDHILGIRRFYAELLEEISSFDLESLTCSQVIDRIEKM